MGVNGRNVAVNFPLTPTLSRWERGAAFLSVFIRVICGQLLLLSVVIFLPSCGDTFPALDPEPWRGMSAKALVPVRLFDLYFQHIRHQVRFSIAGQELDPEIFQFGRAIHQRFFQVEPIHAVLASDE